MTRYEINYPMLRAFRRIWRPVELYLAASEEAEAILNNRAFNRERHIQVWIKAFRHCAERVARRFGVEPRDLILQYDDALNIQLGYLIKAYKRETGGVVFKECGTTFKTMAASHSQYLH